MSTYSGMKAAAVSEVEGRSGANHAAARPPQPVQQQHLLTPPPPADACSLPTPWPASAAYYFVSFKLKAAYGVGPSEFFPPLPVRPKRASEESHGGHTCLRIQQPPAR